jgi:hypothetical protein
MSRILKQLVKHGAVRIEDGRIVPVRQDRKRWPSKRGKRIERVGDLLPGILENLSKRLERTA